MRKNSLYCFDLEVTFFGYRRCYMIKYKSRSLEIIRMQRDAKSFIGSIASGPWHSTDECSFHIFELASAIVYSSEHTWYRASQVGLKTPAHFTLVY